MEFFDRRARKSNARSSRRGLFLPRGDHLEDRLLMTIDLGGTTPPINPNIATAPNGMDFAGGQIGQAAGFSVADVGSVNGQPFDDFVIGAPTAGTTPGTIGTGIDSAAYLVFGSQTVGVSTATDWIAKTAGAFNYTPNDRVGDLLQMTNPPNANPAVQTNPITTTQLDFPFPAIKFVNTINVTSQLGASVAGLRLATGGAILLGAPGALDGNQLNPGTGRAYLISGAFSTYIGKVVDLDDPNFTADFPGLNLVTFVNSASQGAGGKLGASVAGGLNIFGDGVSDVILGAPGASPAPPTPTQITPKTGVVYALSVSALSGSTQTIDVSTLGNGNNTLILSGVNQGDQAGFSVADGGDVNGATTGGTNVDDLLIGAPAAASNSGAAYLVYGGKALAALATTTNGVRYINLSNVGGTVPGAIFTGPAGSETGFSVSTGGDFNGDGFSEILLGSPLFSGSSTLTSQGEATLVYGQTALTGTIALAGISVPAATFTGANAGDMAGFAVSAVGFINPPTGSDNPILIGAPGFKLNAGTAYLINGRAGLVGTFSLQIAESAPLQGIQFVLSTPISPATSPNFFGASVSGRFLTTSTTPTADNDNIADFIIGAPGYDVTQGAANLNAGGAMVIEGGLIKLPIPSSATVTTQIGVGQPFGPFSINATTPANLQIFVFGSTTTTPNFMPVTDIDPKTVKVNGVAFANATLQQDPNTNNYLNGIPDAIITINPRSALKLPNGLDTITITGSMLASSPLAPGTWTGSAAVTVSGGSVTPVISGLAGVPRGPNLLTNFISPYGANQYTPSLTSLSAFNYQPIPVSVGLAQFLPPQGFRQRIYTFNHPGKNVGPYLIDRGQKTGRGGRAQGIHTLSRTVFDRSRFHAQKDYNWTHKGPKVGILKGVIPTQTSRQHFGDNLIH